jgi:trimeric autotransporter adhesin
MKLRIASVAFGFLALVLSVAGQTSTIIAPATAAQVPPPLIQFSGVASDEGGNALGGAVSITFSLYGEQQSREPLWAETQNNVQLDLNGRYSVQLGITQPNGVPTLLFASGEARWLGVQIAGQAEQPRVLLVSVPYALKAGDAATVGGLPPSAFVLNQARNGPASAYSGSGSVQNVAAGVAADVTTTGGKTSFLPVFNGTTTVVDSLVFQSGSGSTATVEVKGSGAFTADTRVDINGLNTGSYTPAIRFGTGNTGEAISSDRAGTVNVNGIDLYTDFTPRLSITNAGSIGIGTQTPAYTLDVDGPGNFLQAGANSSAVTGTSSLPSSSGVHGSGGTGVVGESTQCCTGGNTTYITGPGGSFTGYSQPPQGNSSVYGSDGVITTGGGGYGGESGMGGSGIVSQGGQGGLPQGGVDGIGGVFSGGQSSQYGGDGIDGDAGSGWAGNFNGDLNVTGQIFAGTKDFKIDHPLDPANEYLVHASVESSEMINIYTGNVTTDEKGLSTVKLPEWFGALNTDFRYQLTVIGRFAQAVIGREIENNQFEIMTNAPNVKVSWLVTGARKDAYAKAHPLMVEQQKEARVRGYYIHPELYGAPPNKQIEWARHPLLMRQIQEMRAKQQRVQSSAKSSQPLQNREQ